LSLSLIDGKLVYSRW